MLTILYKTLCPPCEGNGSADQGLTSVSNKAVNRVLVSIDFLLGITLLVVGILGMTHHISSLSSATLQGGLIGGGAVNTFFILAAIALACKESSSYKNKFLLGPDDYTDKAIVRYKLL